MSDKLSDIQLVAMDSIHSSATGVVGELGKNNANSFMVTDILGFLDSSGTVGYVEDHTDTLLKASGIETFEIKDAKGRVIESFKGTDEVTKAVKNTFVKLEAAIKAEKDGNGTLMHSEDLAERLEAVGALFAKISEKSTQNIADIRDKGQTRATTEIEIFRSNKVVVADMFQHVHDTLNADPATVDIDAANAELLKRVKAVDQEADYSLAFMEVVSDFHQGNAKVCKEAAAVIRSNLKAKEPVSAVAEDTAAKAGGEPVAKAAVGAKQHVIGHGQC